jgi:hypothetical protein
MQDEKWWQQVADKPHMLWCLKVASLGVDELARAKLVPQNELERATKIVAEEIFVRLCAGDMPPAGRP